MTPEEARKLLGGYATGTLTEAEEQALFAAALEDQSLFDELAREQSLRDLLRDPAAKSHLLAALDEPRQSWWWSWKPAAVLAMAGVAAVAVVIGTRKAPAPVEIVAKVEMPKPPAPVATVPIEPAPQATAPKPEARRKLSAPAAPAPKVEVELADAPKAESLKAEEATPRVLEMAAPPAAPAIARDLANPSVNPMLERAANARIQAFAVGPPSARALFLGTTSTPLRVQPVAAQAVASPQALGLRYSIVQPEGQAPVLRITSNVNGYVSVGGATPVSLTAMRAHTTDPLTGDEVKVVFSRRPETTAAQPGAPLTEVSGGETYVVSPTGAALSFTVPLKKP
jgi:hypothetical protein